MQDLLIVEEVDARRADAADDSRAITITKLALPPIKRLTAEHAPGGGIGKVNFSLPMIEVVEPKFSTKGLDLDTMSKIGFTAGTFDKWTFAGTVRNKRTNVLLPLRATIQGIVGDWSPGEHTPGELLDCDHAMQEVSYYRLDVGGVRQFEWDFYNRVWWNGTVDVFAEYRANLGA